MARRKLWIPFNNGGTQGAGGQGSTADLLAAAATIINAELFGATIIRIVGNLSFRCDVVLMVMQGGFAHLRCS